MHNLDQPLRIVPETRPYWQEILHAFVYPLTPLGLVVIVGTGAIMAFLTDPDGLMAALSKNPRPALYGILLSGIVLYYFFEVIQTSAGGTRWFPSIMKSDFEWHETLLYGVEGAVVSYLPEIVYVLGAFAMGAGISRMIFEVLRALGCLYLPMALLSLAIWRDWQAVMPHVVLPLVRKIPRAVVLSAALLWTANSLHIEAIRGSFSGASFGIVLCAFIASAYLYFVAARVIGIAHWVYRKEIGWFEYD